MAKGKNSRTTDSALEEFADRLGRPWALRGWCRQMSRNYSRIRAASPSPCSKTQALQGILHRMETAEPMFCPLSYGLEDKAMNIFPVHAVKRLLCTRHRTRGWLQSTEQDKYKLLSKVPGKLN